MSRLASRAAWIALAALALSACATPTYAPRAGYTAPAPAQPKYASQPPAVAESPPPAPAPAAAPPAAAPPPIEATPLPPPSPAPASAPSPTPAEVAPPPPSAPQAYTPPPPPVRETVRRTVPGKVIAGGKVVTAKGMFRDYDVQKKDHVDAIARDLGVTRKVIVDANHLKPPFRLQPGEHLRVPVEKAYVAESGDTLADVARRFDVGAGDLASLNDLSGRARLRAGERIALPAAFHDRGPTRGKPTVVTEFRTVPAAAGETYAASPPTRARPLAQTQPPTVSPPRPVVQAPPPRSYVQTAAPPAQASYAPARPTIQAYAPPPRPLYPSQTTGAGVAPQMALADIAAAGRGKFIWPVRGDIIATFGVRAPGQRNDGVDIRAPLGAVILAAAGGNVVYAGNQVPGFGNLVLVKHPDGWVTAYAHLETITVQMRQNIAQGQEIGQVGETGGVTQPELHFEVRFAATPSDRARPVDPMAVLPR